MKKKGFKILNSRSYIKDAIRWLMGKNKYPCKAGKNIIFIDWDMNVYPCFEKQKICKLEELNKNFLHEFICNACSFQCFREPSIFYSNEGKIEFLLDIKNFIPAIAKIKYLMK